MTKKKSLMIISNTVLFCVVLIIIVCSINSPNLSIQSKTVFENDLPVIVISGDNYSNENYYLTVTGVEYRNMYSTVSALYEIENNGEFYFKVEPAFRTDDCLSKTNLSYTMHLYKNKGGKLKEIKHKTITDMNGE